MPFAPASSPLDVGAHRELVTLLGANKIERLLVGFETRLRSSFAQTKAGPVDRVELGREAHSVVSQAGMLGFIELSGVCRDLETVCLDAGDPAPLLERVRWARDRAVQEILSLRATRR